MEYFCSMLDGREDSDRGLCALFENGTARHANLYAACVPLLVYPTTCASLFSYGHFHRFTRLS